MSISLRTALSKSHADIHTHLRSHIPTHTCITVDLNRYITDIENEVEAQHDRGSSRTFRTRIRPQNQKPILRTLLGIPSRDEFDDILRTQIRLVGHERMKQFCTDVLRPRIHVLPEYIKWGEDYLPSFDSGWEDAISLSHKGHYAFHRMSSGRKYKGQMLDMVSDLCPDLILEYQSIIAPLTEEEIYLHTIDYVASQNNLDAERVEAAKKCVALCQQYSTDSGSTSSNGSGTNREGDEHSHLKSKANGLFCEQSCFQWLENRIGNGDMNGTRDHDEQSSSSLSSPFSGANSTMSHQQPIILQNVMVNSIRTKSRPKYNNNDTTSEYPWNILWTSSQRMKVCSEFDAVVLQPHANSPHQVHISEIWEAKTSLSPSSIHDLLTKKLPAIQTILDDEGVTMNLCNANVHGTNTNTTSNGNGNSSAYENHRELQQVHIGEKLVTFGIYGMDIIPPSNAVGQLRSTAVSYALASDYEFTMRAVEKGFVEMDLDCILADLAYLRQKLTDGRAQFDIVAKVVSTTSPAR